MVSLVRADNFDYRQGHLQKLPQQVRVSWSQYALQVPPAHRNAVGYNPLAVLVIMYQKEGGYDSIAGVGETGVWLRADFQSGSRVLKKVF